MYLTIAWRNIWRNRRRSLITILSITFAVLLACVMRSLQHGSYDRMIENGVGFYTGYIQIHKKGYWDEKVIDNSFTLDTSLIDKVTDLPGVVTYVPRLESFAFAALGNQTKGTLVMGIDPVNENEMTRLKSKMAKGNYLKSDDDGVLVAQGLADYLNAKPGDTLTLIGQGYHGAPAAGLFPIRGIVMFATPQQNNQLVYMTLARAQWFYAADGLTTSVALMIEDPEQTNSIVNSIYKLTDPNDYEVMGWRELVPELVQSIELDNIGGKVMLCVLYLVIGFGMFGTYLMMTAERQYEFSVMIAVGMKRFRLQSVVFLEILLMTILGVFAGIILSLPLLTWLHFHPIRFGEEAAKAIESFGVEAIYAFSLNPTIFSNQAYAIFIMATILSIYPLWKIRKMKVVESMRA